MIVDFNYFFFIMPYACSMDNVLQAERCSEENSNEYDVLRLHMCVKDVSVWRMRFYFISDLNTRFGFNPLNIEHFIDI